MMDPMYVYFFAVVGIHFVYRAYALHRAKRDRVLRERVAYMLWCCAQQAA